MSVTLEPNPCVKGQTRRNEAVLASHNPIGQWLGYPCIHIIGGKSPNNYPFVHFRNIMQILNHESVHIVLTSLSLDDESKQLDCLFRLLPQSKKIFG